MTALLRQHDARGVALLLPEAYRARGVWNGNELALLLGHALVELRVDRVQLIVVLVDGHQICLRSHCLLQMIAASCDRFVELVQLEIVVEVRGQVINVTHELGSLRVLNLLVHVDGLTTLPFYLVELQLGLLIVLIPFLVIAAAGLLRILVHFRIVLLLLRIIVKVLRVDTIVHRSLLLKHISCDI